MPRAGLTAARVVEAAAAVADEVGLDRLTLAAVAERFGVALPSLYKHVDGVDGLRRDLAVLGTAELAAAITGAAVGRAGRDALAAMADAYRSFARARPGLYAATVRAPEPGDGDHEAAARAALDVVFAVMRGYGIEGDEAVHAVRVLRAAFHGFVTTEAAGGFGMPQSVDESYRRLVAVLDGAFSTWGRTP